jgi:two-component system, response regulator YesN
MYKVIIADDEPWTLYRIQNLINWNALGFEVSGTAIDGLSALEMIKSTQPDLLLSDIRMPGLDGLALVREVKSASPNTVVIFITGFSEFSYAQEALRQGVLDYLVKPVRKEDLCAALNRVLDLLKKKASPAESETMPDIPISQIQKILHTINENYTQDIHLSDLAEQFYLSTTYLSILIKKETGTTFSELIIRKRIALAKKLLTETDLPIQDIMDQVGYKDYSCFIRLFKKHMNCTPYAYRKHILSPKPDNTTPF